MNDRSEMISKLRADRDFREDYITAKLDVLISSQLRALRLHSDTPTQKELSLAFDMKQSRVSGMETPGAVNFALNSLIRMAANHKVGLVVKFVSFSEMLEWENSFSQDDFIAVRIDQDEEFIAGEATPIYLAVQIKPDFEHDEAVVSSATSEMTQAATEQTGTAREAEDLGNIHPAVFGSEPTSSKFARYSIQ